MCLLVLSRCPCSLPGFVVSSQWSRARRRAEQRRRQRSIALTSLIEQTQTDWRARARGGPREITDAGATRTRGGLSAREPVALSLAHLALRSLSISLPPQCANHTAELSSSPFLLFTPLLPALDMSGAADASSSSGGAAASGAKTAAGETNALNLRWCFGFNSSVANTVHSLSSANRNALFYVSAHTGIIHDLQHDQQFLLQGHCNQITSVCVSKDKRWIATADFGPDSMLVVWDALRATPVKILPTHPDHGGIAAMDMSADAMFLVTLSYNYPQVLSVWEWPANSTTPAISAPIGNRDYQHCVRFNPVDVRDLVSNGQREVIFWNWNEDSIAAFHPPKGISKLKKAVRNLSQTTFIPYTTRAVTATTSGHIIAWDYPVSELVQSTGRDAIKILKLVKSGINLLDTVLDKFLVCGCADGAVRFFDFQFRVVAWFEDIQAGHITSISFADQGANAGGPSASAAPTAQAGQVSMEEFAVPDFVVGTSSGKVLQLDSKTMEHLTADKRRGKLLVQGFDDEVHALDAHPTLPLFAVGTSKGSLQIWDVDDRKMVAYRKFEEGESSSSGSATGHATNKAAGTTGSGGKKTDVSASLTAASAAAKGPAHKDELINASAQIQCLKFGPKGLLLAMGFANGFVKVVSSAEAGSGGSMTGTAAESGLHVAPPLRDVCSFHRSEGSITNLVFSSDGNWISTSDAEGCVAVYRFWHKDDDLEKPMEWIYVGKYKAHYKPIVNLFFEATGPNTAAAAQPAQPAAQSTEDESSSPPGTASGRSARSNLNALALATNAALSPHNALSATLRSIPRLYSLGEDRVLQEYDLKSSSIRAGLKISSSTKLEQTACPTAMMSLPGRPLGHSGAGKPQQKSPDLIITANDEYKIKVWEVISAAAAAAAEAQAKAAATARAAALKAKQPQRGKLGAKSKESLDPLASMSPSEFEEYSRRMKCRKTLLAPMYGGSINKMFNLPKREAVTHGHGGGGGSNKSGIVPSDYLVYSTFDKVVGLIKLPLDGNPNKSMALIAHPGEVSCVVATFDGKYLITSGGSDRSVNLWAVATNALDASITLGGKGIDPYLSLIDGGRKGPFFQELLDYFYYAQLRSQGLATTQPRKITGYITVDEGVNLMRALGFYPSEQQIVAIKAEIRYENQALLDAKTGGPSASASGPARSADLLNLDEFLKLYVNHRPVFGLGAKAFESAFAALGAMPKRDFSMSSEQLVTQLMTLGDEPMSMEEIEQALDALLGERFVPKDAQDVNGRNGQHTRHKQLCKTRHTHPLSSLTPLVRFACCFAFLSLRSVGWSPQDFVSSPRADAARAIRTGHSRIRRLCLRTGRRRSGIHPSCAQPATAVTATTGRRCR